MREQARAIRDATLDNLAAHLEAFEAKATAMGSAVHWAADATEARRDHHGHLPRTPMRAWIVKGKSMVSEEIGLNAHLEEQGLEVIESDLGEYIIQKRGEPPSHIIAPAIHLTEADVEADFRSYHTHLPPDRPLAQPGKSRLGSPRSAARKVSRQPMSASPAPTSSSPKPVHPSSSPTKATAISLRTLPRIHIVVATIDKVVPTLDEAMTLLRVLARSATGQDMTAYTTLRHRPAPRR